MLWSTDEVAPRERFDFWREAVCDAFLDLRAERDRRSVFAGSIRVAKRSRLEIATIAADAQRVARRPTHDGGWCYLNLQTAGIGLTSQGGETIRTGPGDAVVVRTDRPFDFEFADTFAQCSIKLPSELNDLLETPVLLPASSMEGKALASLVALSNPAFHPGTARHSDSGRDPSSAGRSSVDRSMVDEWLDAALIDLVRTAVLERRPWRTSRPSDDPWPLIDADIDRHLGDPALSPRQTARRVGVSVRVLHHAFDDRPLTYSREVRHRRLVRANSMLRDPARDSLRIRDIAADCGLIDLQHFQRIYRAMFGQTPGSTRAERHR